MRGAGVGDGGHRRAGRPRAFDAGQVLDCAMDRFWRDGYERVSVPDLSAATGLSTSSIYNSFGSKHGLYLACLDRYLDQLGQYLLGPMASGTAGTEDIAAFLDRLAAAQGSAAGPPGCLATNSIAEFGAGDAAVLSRTSRYRHDLRAALVAALRRAAGLGELQAGACS